MGRSLEIMPFGPDAIDKALNQLTLGNVVAVQVGHLGGMFADLKRDPHVLNKVRGRPKDTFVSLTLPSDEFFGLVDGERVLKAVRWTVTQRALARDTLGLMCHTRAPKAKGVELPITAVSKGEDGIERIQNMHLAGHHVEELVRKAFDEGMLLGVTAAGVHKAPELIGLEQIMGWLLSDGVQKHNKVKLLIVDGKFRKAAKESFSIVDITDNLSGKLVQVRPGSIPRFALQRLLKTSIQKLEASSWRDKRDEGLKASINLLSLIFSEPIEFRKGLIEYIQDKATIAQLVRRGIRLRMMA